MPADAFERLSAFPALWTAWQHYRRDKRRRPAVAEFDLDADLAILRLHRDLAQRSYAPSPYRISLVADPKIRLIAAPAVRDRVLQRALLDCIGPTYERGFVDPSFAVCSGRGSHRAALAYLGWMRAHRYRLHLDIRHYFASICHERLLGLFARRLGDPRALRLIADLLAAGGAVYRHPLARLALGEHSVPAGCGLPLGGYLSHWSGGFFLDGMDHHVKRVLKIPGYLRYMDDFALFADDPGRLAGARDALGDWLGRERGLALKDPAAQPLDNRLPTVFLGFRIGRPGIGPGPKALHRLRRRLRRIDRLDPDYLARSLIAFRGMWGALGGGGSLSASADVRTDK